MNRSNNERYQATEDKIIQAFIQLLSEKEVPAITVSEICRMSGIHRTSFYLHFQDVYELMDRIEIRLTEYYANLFESKSEYYDLGERFQRLFAFVYEHQAFYRAYWHRSKDLRVLDAAISESTASKMKETAAAHGFQTDTEIQFHQIFFKAGLAALIGYWLSRSCPETPQALGEILKKEYWNRTQSAQV